MTPERFREAPFTRELCKTVISGTRGKRADPESQLNTPRLLLDSGFVGFADAPNDEREIFAKLSTLP